MPSARGTCGRFRARAPTNGPSRCLIVPSGLATRSPGARDSNAQIVPTSSDTRGVIGKTVNYFCPVMKGAQKSLGNLRKKKYYQNFEVDSPTVSVPFLRQYPS